MWYYIVYILSIITAAIFVYFTSNDEKYFTYKDIILLCCVTFVPVLNTAFCFLMVIYSIVSNETQIKNPFYKEDTDV